MSPDMTPEAIVVPPTAKERRRISLIWIIPLVTVAIGGWLVYDTLSKRGPTITITFDSGDGLQAGQSTIKYKDIQMGHVEKIAVSDDLQHVIVSARMEPEAARLLNDRAKFWVVRPQLFAGNIQGLGTLLSGSFIGFLPSTEGIAGKRDFTGLENPPVLQTAVPGRTFMLHADRIGALTLGSPIYYRDLEVGTVLGWDLGALAENVTVHAFVRAPFDQYVHDGSRFWNASGVSLGFSGGQVRLEVDSLKSIFLGGIAFETSQEALATPQATENEPFTLFSNRNSATTAGYKWRVRMMTFVDTSVGGLAAGSQVTIRGIPVGEVTSVGLRFDPADGRVVLPVAFELFPERITGSDKAPWGDPPALMKDLVQRGLRIQIESSNFVTGAQQLALDFVPNAPAAEMRMDGDVIVLPSVSGGLGGIMSSVQHVLDQVSAMPLATIGDNLSTLIKGLDTTVNGAQMKAVLVSMQGSLNDLQRLLSNTDVALSPALRNLPAIASNLNQTLAQAAKLSASLDTGYGDNSAFKRDLGRLLSQATDAIRSVRVLADILSRNPEALIRGTTNTGVEK